MICTFFGHRDCPELQPRIRAILEELITNHHVDMFYVGDSGRFDHQVHAVLKQLSREFPHIRYGVVLSRMPKPNPDKDASSDLMLPEGIELIHPKYSIDWRNRWMLSQSDYVVTHIRHNWGGAWKYAELARKRKKHVINIDI